jgi:hypothetical protein
MERRGTSKREEGGWEAEGAAALAAVERGALPAAQLARWLRSSEAALVHAAVLHLERRVREEGEEALRAWASDGGAPAEGAAAGASGWTRLLPDELFALPPESQLVLAALARDGYGVVAPEPPATLAPAVQLAWWQGRLLQRPTTLRALAGRSLARAAVLGLPAARVVASGLCEELLASGDAGVREAALPVLREGLAGGWLAPERGEAWLFALAVDGCAPIAAAALGLLGAPWSCGRGMARGPLSALVAEVRASGDLERQRALVQLLVARRARHELLRWLTATEVAPAPAVYRELVAALGQIGDAEDRVTLLACLGEDPHLLGDAALGALVALTRRGAALEEDAALALARLFFAEAALPAAAVAECCSGRADAVVAALDPLVAEAAGGEAAAWPRAVALLEGFGTRGAVARLRELCLRESERAGWRDALGALGAPRGARGGSRDLGAPRRRAGGGAGGAGAGGRTRHGGGAGGAARGGRGARRDRDGAGGAALAGRRGAAPVRARAVAALARGARRARRAHGADVRRVAGLRRARRVGAGAGGGAAGGASAAPGGADRAGRQRRSAGAGAARRGAHRSR